MPANTLAWSHWITVTYDPHKPDAVITKQDVAGEGAACLDCPMLRQEGLPAFISGTTRERTATVLCDQLEKYATSGMVRGCQMSQSRLCNLHGQSAVIGAETLPLRVFDRNVVEASYDHRHRTDDMMGPEMSIDTLPQERVERMAQATALSSLTKLHDAQEAVLQMRKALPQASPEVQRALFARLLRIQEICVFLQRNLED